MTKEKLEKEAEEWLDDERKYIIEDDEGFLINISKKVKEAYVSGAEPREKQITELGERCLQLQKDKGNLIDRVRDLEAQIEKMKSDAISNIKWADQNKNSQMYCKLNAMINQWEVKENESK